MGLDISTSDKSHSGGQGSVAEANHAYQEAPNPYSDAAKGVSTLGNQTGNGQLPSAEFQDILKNPLTSKVVVGHAFAKSAPMGSDAYFQEDGIKRQVEVNPAVGKKQPYTPKR